MHFELFLHTYTYAVKQPADDATFFIIIVSGVRSPRTGALLICSDHSWEINCENACYGRHEWKASARRDYFWFRQRSQILKSQFQNNKV